MRGQYLGSTMQGATAKDCKYVSGIFMAGRCTTIHTYVAKTE